MLEPGVGLDGSPLNEPVTVVTVVLPEGAMVMEKDWVTDLAGEALSVTVTMNVKLPAAEGVPLTTPEMKVSPGGNVVELQKYGGVPPWAVTVAE
jgi:hypothetical protein